MEEIKLKLNEKSVQKLKLISKATNREVSEIIDDLVVTFCCAPTVVIADLEDVCVNALEKCDTDDKHRKSSFTNQRIKGFERIKYFAEMVFSAQEQTMKEYEKYLSENNVK